ncbi:MAG: hypothetical protein RI958_2301 [Actinomycetota bacterium]|jgi:DNA-binding MarR family transcriptional regulator
MADSTVADSTRWLDADEMAAWRGYIDTLAPLHHRFEADLAEFGLTVGDYEVLVWLSEVDEHQLRMCDLAAQLRITPSGLTRRLDGLVRNGLVRRQASADDKRVMMAVLTERGHELLVRAAPSHLDSVRRHFIDLLSQHEVAALGSAFAKVRAALAAGQDACS